MTDSEGTRHRITLPPGKVAPQIWARQKDRATQTLPPPFAELVAATAQAFVQAITDAKATRMVDLGGKMVFVGDALAAFRPHTAASTSQAAFHALLLQQVLDGQMTFQDMEQVAMPYANRLSASGIRMGNASQFGHL